MKSVFRDGKRISIPLDERDLELEQQTQDVIDDTEWIRRRTAPLAEGGYGTWQEQEDMKFHHGFEYWRAHIQAVKDRFPKRR